jgi:hypothetical protein
MKNKMEVDLGTWWNPFTWFQKPVTEVTPATWTPSMVTAPPAEAAETIASVAPWTVSQVTAPPISAIPTITQVAKEVAPASTNIFTQILNTLQVPLQKVADFLLTKGQMEAAASIAQSQAEAQRAAQAIVEAQERIYATQVQQQKERQGILSTEAWKKATPYVIPVAAGLAIVALLLVVGKGEKKKK